MSVSSELLCSFELLKPLDSSALKSHIKKARTNRQNMINSPVCIALAGSAQRYLLMKNVARKPVSSKLLESTRVPAGCDESDGLLVRGYSKMAHEEDRIKSSLTKDSDHARQCATLIRERSLSCDTHQGPQLINMATEGIAPDVCRCSSSDTTIMMAYDLRDWCKRQQLCQ